MIDILIIIAYILVALKVLLKLFTWFEQRFQLNGRTQALVQNVQQVETQSKNQKINNIEPIVQKGTSQTSSAQKIKLPQVQKKIQEVKQQPVQTKVQEPKKISEVIYQNKISGNKIQQIKAQQKVQGKSQNKQKLQQKRQNIIQTQQNIKVEDEDLRTAYEALKKQIQELKNQKSLQAQKIQTFLDEKQSLQQSKWSLAQQLIQTKQNYENLILQMRQQHLNELQQQKKFTQTHQQVQNILSQTNQFENAHNAQTQRIQTQNIKELEQRVQHMKNQLEFCQSQLQGAEETERKLKEQIEQLKSNTGSRLKSRTGVSITDVINHSEYLRIKQKLQKYENGISASRPRSIIRGQFTPQGDRLSKATDSRISQRRSFISSKMHDGGQKLQGSEQVFGQCSFLDQQNKNFLLEQVKKIKKLAIKKTKLIFKLDKLNPINPHEHIDNIPNIIILIELTNKKVLAGFTQIAFSKEDGNNEKSLVSRSRLGSNKALIMDLTNKISFTNNSANDTIIYDENAIVWGRDELVIKNDEPTLLYSAFASGNGVYGDGKYTLQDLMGSEQGFERINQYEFHRIYIN